MFIVIWVWVFSVLINQMIKGFDRTVHSLFIVEDCNILVTYFLDLFLEEICGLMPVWCLVFVPREFDHIIVVLCWSPLSNMSRCSPYPPLGYVWKGVCGEALVELVIKVKREWAAAEKERKKEKRKQRKKKKEKTREKRKIKKKEQSSDKRNWSGWNAIDWEKSDHQKKREYEPQKLENFNLSEELEQHIVSESLGHSFYNGENFNRRKPCSFPCCCHKLHDDGNIIWTEFLPQKHMDPKVQTTPNRMEKFEMDATPDKVHIFPTSGLCEYVAQGMDPRPGWMLCHSASQRATNEGATETVPMTCITESHSLHESQLRELLENWVPDPQLSEHTEFDDQEWLFETRSVQKNTTEWSKPISDDLRHGSSTLYPYARYLPKADLYALPFTIIF
ncbi:hypothetical protein VitviT2T_003124 [Vitis vinifera]|uniref:Uncharacterized protein n=2 Tax=Vitis vinifera TaxID=29760 RepID=A0ABY9BKW4_VITVI|nr:uncharacterized protein LOC104878349 [Vitis vinifera]WJZ83440.1 hypothetical protein VitviT2T_003124 [Vitis vinifera]|eukprot:XP_010646868.1 PREDICTED: uncharacterized protein LOC104878349 [Vitis vinifera]